MPLTYIPAQEGSRTTGNTIVGVFRERNVGVETRTTATQVEGREVRKLKERAAQPGWGGKGETGRSPFQLLTIQRRM